MKSRVKVVFLFLLGILIGAAVSAGIVLQTGMNKVIKWKEMSDKHLNLFLLMVRWVQIKQEGKNIAGYLIKCGFRTIAVYGTSYAGQCLIEELGKSEVKIAYGIDKNIGGVHANVRVVSPNDELKAVDAVIVTSITFFDEIKKSLREKIDCPVISLEDILFEV